MMSDWQTVKTLCSVFVLEQKQHFSEEGFLFGWSEIKMNFNQLILFKCQNQTAIIYFLILFLCSYFSSPKEELLFMLHNYKCIDLQTNMSFT